MSYPNIGNNKQQFSIRQVSINSFLHKSFVFILLHRTAKPNFRGIKDKEANTLEARSTKGDPQHDHPGIHHSFNFKHSKTILYSIIIISFLYKKVNCLLNNNCCFQPTVTTAGDGSSMSANQRAALHNAHATSTGFFISTDSSFGNWILPVLPRFDAK